MSLSIEEITQLIETSEKLKADLECAEAELAVAQKERQDLYEVGIGVMNFMGVLDPATNKLRAELASKEESPFPYILKSLGSVTTLVMKAQAPKFMGGAQAEKELNEKFGFVTKLIELVSKHGNRD